MKKKHILKENYERLFGQKLLNERFFYSYTIDELELLNIISDFYAGQFSTADDLKDYKSAPGYATLMNKYKPISEKFFQLIVKHKDKPIPKGVQDDLEGYLYTGSDAYEPELLDSLFEVYDQQIELLSEIFDVPILKR